MFTRCPECRTSFRVGARQLQQAAGRVRCGICGVAFNALASLHEGPDGPPPDESVGPPRARPDAGNASRARGTDWPAEAAGNAPDEPRFDDHFGIDDLDDDATAQSEAGRDPDTPSDDAPDEHTTGSPVPEPAPRNTPGDAADDDFSDFASLLLDETGGFDLDTLWDERAAAEAADDDAGSLPTLTGGAPEPAGAEELAELAERTQAAEAAESAETVESIEKDGTAAERQDGVQGLIDDEHGDVAADDEDTARHRWHDTPLEALRAARNDDDAHEAAPGRLSSAREPVTDGGDDSAREATAEASTEATPGSAHQPSRQTHGEAVLHPADSGTRAGSSEPDATGLEPEAHDRDDEASAEAVAGAYVSAAASVGVRREQAVEDAATDPSSDAAAGPDAPGETPDAADTGPPADDTSLPATPAPPPAMTAGAGVRRDAAPADAVGLAASTDVPPADGDAGTGADQDTPHPFETAAAQPRERRRAQRLWTAVAGVALLALAAQGVHHFRHELAAHPALGPWVSGLYGGVGVAVQPAWPLEAYELQASNEAGRIVGDVLHIGADLGNRQSRPLPLPLLRVTLLDRWGEPVGHRVFAPAEYAGQRARAPLSPGEGVEARLAVQVEDAREVYGYRLEVCRRAGNGGLLCH